MKVALVTGTPVLPADQGNSARLLALSRAVRAEGHDLWLIRLAEHLIPADERRLHIGEFGADRFLALAAPAPIRRVARAASQRMARVVRRRLFPTRAYHQALDSLWWPHWGEDLARRHAQLGFDIVIATYVFHSAALSALPEGPLRVIDAHDGFADRHIRYLAHGQRDFFFSLSAEDEARGFKRADAVVAIHSDEERRFRACLRSEGPEVLTISHFLENNAPPVSGHQGHTALFLGSDNAANRQGLAWLIAEILPLIVARLPGFRLVVAGSVCNNLPRHPAVVPLGRVASVGQAFAAAPVLLCALQLGTGIAIKLLDAMAAGVPVVGTDTGLRGLPGRYEGFTLRVADNDPGAFARETVALLTDPPRRAAMGATARSLARQWNTEQTAALRRLLALSPGRTPRTSG